MADIGERYILTPALSLFCRDCGALIMEGYRSEHDRMHPAFSCAQLGCGSYHEDAHPWESIYPRRKDTR